MNKIISLIIFITGVATFTATAQSAADRATVENTVGFGPRLGYYQASDAVEGNFYGGLHMRFRLGKVVGLEGTVEYRPGQEFGFEGYSVTTSFVPVTGSFMLFAPISEHISPYGLAGIGAYYTIYDFSDEIGDLGIVALDNEFNVGYHLGFGTELLFSPNVGLSIDYRYLFLNPDTGDESFEDSTFDSNIFTAGLIFYF